MYFPKIVADFLDRTGEADAWPQDQVRAILRDPELSSSERDNAAAAYVRHWLVMNDQQKEVVQLLDKLNVKFTATLTHVTLEKTKYGRHYRAHYAVTWQRAAVVYQHTFNMGITSDVLKRGKSSLQANHAADLANYTLSVETVRTLVLNSSGPLSVDVLSCILSDAQTVEYCSSVDDFAAEFCEGLGFSETLRIWEACQEANRKVAALFGDRRSEVEEAMQDY